MGQAGLGDGHGEGAEQQAPMGRAIIGGVIGNQFGSGRGRTAATVGGVGCNIARNLARLGVPTALVTVVGQDEFGERILREARSVAVLGAKTGAREPAYYVPAYLHARGYQILAVNPILAGQTMFDAPVVPTLADLPRAVDVIEIFRRPEYLGTHAREILALPWRPRAVWLQLGIRNDGAAAVLTRAGIDVVQDRCMMPEHRRLLGAA